MGKIDSERMNLRLKSEARFMLEEIAESKGISKTAVIEQAIAAMYRAPQRNAYGEPGYSIPYSTLVSVERQSPASMDALRALVAPTAPRVETGPPKRFRCGHCGREKTVSQIGMACEGCEEKGHEHKDVRECRECQEGFAA